METENNSEPVSCQNMEGSRSTPTPSPAYAQVLSNCWNATSSPKPGEAISKCLLCFQEEVSLAEADNSSSSRRSKLVKNFFEYIQLDSEKIPEQCSKKMFPFCERCESELDLMFELKQTILKLESNNSMMAKKMEKNVVREAVNWGTNPFHQAADKFLDMIMEGYHKRQEGDTDVTAVDSTGPTDSQSGLNDSRQNRGNKETNNDETTPNNTEAETVTVNVNPEACPLSVALKKEATIGQQFFASNEYRESDDDDEIQQVSTSQKRRTLCEGVEYFQRIRRPGNETYLQCSLCPHTVPNVKKKFKPGELTPHRILALHMQTAHKRVCENVGAQSESSQPQPSTSRDSLNVNAVEAENELVNPTDGDDPEHYILEPRKRKYTFHSVEISKYVGSQNPNKKYLKCGRCKRTFPMIPNNKKGEVEAYAKIKTHIQTTHRNTTQKKLAAKARAEKLAAQKAQSGGAPCLQSDQLRVKLESPRPGPSFMNYCARPLNSGNSLNDDGGENVDMPPVPTDHFTQPSVADGDEMSLSAFVRTDDGLGLVADEGLNMIQTPSPAPYSPFYKYVCPSETNMGGV